MDALPESNSDLQTRVRPQSPPALAICVKCLLAVPCPLTLPLLFVDFRYAYGAAGAPPDIPANATLKFDVRSVLHVLCELC